MPESQQAGLPLGNIYIYLLIFWHYPETVIPMGGKSRAHQTGSQDLRDPGPGSVPT